MIGANSTVSKIDRQEYLDFCSFLESSCGIVLGESKQYLVESRLKNLISLHGHNSLGSLVAQLKSGNNSTLREHTIDAMTTNETSWFRDNFPYTALTEIILPDLIARGNKHIRLWSSACSSGQEPYSIAMILEEYRQSGPQLVAEILATDISPTMLKQAKEGYFDNLSMARGLSVERKDKYFSIDGAGWQVDNRLKRDIKFREVNLQSSFSSFGKFDVIFCRNVLIYFSLPLKQDIINRLSQSLNPGGYLVLGGTESALSFSSDLQAIRHQNGMFYQLK